MFPLLYSSSARETALICPLKLITESNTSLHREGQVHRKGKDSKRKHVPYDSLRVNEERDTSLGETLQTAADDVCLSGFTRLIAQHRVLSFVVVVRTRRLHECEGESAHTVTLFLVANSLIAETGSPEIPTTVMPDSLNSTFSKCTRHPSAVVSLSYFITGY